MIKGDSAKMINNGVPELSKKEFDSFISEGTTVIDFFAEWCMPCLMMAPVIEELSGKLKGKIKFGKVNVDDNQELSGKFKIQSIPNLIVFKNGKQIAQFIGGVSADELEEKLKKL
jgi:thioredoxin 1